MLLAPASARADHQHGGLETPRSSIAAGVSLVTAAYENMFYRGDYQGAVPTVRGSYGRFAASASMGMYRLQENGRELVGPNDLMLHTQATLVRRGRGTAGVVAAASLPTGTRMIGMGHPMLMPAAYARWSSPSASVGGSLGYGQAIGGMDHNHGAHGATGWPLVDPMNQSEVTWSANADLALAPGLRTGGRFSGGVPVGDGNTRVVGGVRIAWSEGRVDTTFEVQAGIAGDPFTLRGVLETAVRF